MEVIMPKLRPQLLNGKVVASFEFDEWDITPFDIRYQPFENKRHKGYCFSDRELKELCLTEQQLLDYGKGKPLYAWHIKDLQVFDEPVELGELYKDWDIFDTDSNGKYVGDYVQVISVVKKAPQSYQYVYYKGEKCLLLPIKPQHCYNILQGKKTIEIRKSVPKELR
jgi:hypothetical protein